MKYHTVLFKLKPEAPAGEADRIFERISSLQGRVEGIVSIEPLVIEKSNPANRYSHGFTVSFANEIKRDAFLANSLPSEVAADLYKFVEDSMILDMDRKYLPHKPLPVPPITIPYQIKAKTQ